MSDARNIERCREEIADIDRALRDGHPNLQVLCFTLADWSANVRIIKGKMRFKVRKPAKAEAGRAAICTERAYFGRL